MLENKAFQPMQVSYRKGGMMMDLEQKSIERIKLAAMMSEQYYDAPLICTYSGGKDSDVMLELFKRSEVNFEVVNSHTTVDAPQTVYHIRNKFKELEEQGIKATVIYPAYKGKRTSMWETIVKKGAPTRIHRWCCALFKETSAPGRMLATGVRWAESVKRANRGEFETIGRTVKEGQTATYEDVILENDNDKKRKIIDRCEIKGKVVANPIIDWQHRDIWEYLHCENIEYNPLYDMGYSRVGCIGCPMAGYVGRCKEFSDFPVYKANYMKAFDRFLKRKEAEGHQSKLYKTAQEMFDWWMEDPKMQGQISLFEEE